MVVILVQQIIIMKFEPREQLAQLFIEAPKRSDKEKVTEKAAYHADLSQGYDEEDVHANLYNADMPFYEANERYD